MLEKKREINTYTKSLNAYLRPKTVKANIATEKKKTQNMNVNNN